MKQGAVTVRLDDDLQPPLDEVCRRSGRTRSEVVREALRRHLARGYLTDEDVFNKVS
jgi:predicted transcriptional regulator